MLVCQHMIGLHVVKKWIWCANYRLTYTIVVDLGVGLGVTRVFLCGNSKKGHVN